MLNPIICAQCLQPNEPARKLCWKCMRALNIAPREKDFLRLFGLPAAWSKEQLKTSFLRLAKQYHPDANPGNPEADAHFKFVNNAYEILSKLPEGKDTVQPASGASGGTAQSMEMASKELYDKLRAVLRDQHALNMQAKPLTLPQRIAKWFYWLWTGKE
jgi:hypothetical protein